MNPGKVALISACTGMFLVGASALGYAYHTTRDQPNVTLYYPFVARVECPDESKLEIILGKSTQGAPIHCEGLKEPIYAIGYKNNPELPIDQRVPINQILLFGYTRDGQEHLIANMIGDSSRSLFLIVDKSTMASYDKLRAEILSPDGRSFGSPFFNPIR